MGTPLSLPFRGGGTGSVSLNHYTGVLSPSPTQSGGGNGLSFGWHLFLPLTVFLFSISYSLSLSLLCLGLFSSSSLASSSLHLLLPSWLLVLPGPLTCPLGWDIKVSLPSALGPFQLLIPTASPPSAKNGGFWGGGRFWHSTPQLQVWAQGLFPCLSVYLTPAIWGGYWATTTTTRRSVLLCPVADKKT